MKLVARTSKAPIKAIIDNVPSDGAINTQAPILATQGGTPSINHTGETELQHGSAEPKMKYGEALYLCENDEIHLAGDLLLRSPDGRYEAIEGLVQPKPVKPLVGEVKRQLAALEYATWIIRSGYELATKQIDIATHERVHWRAHEYAEAAGAEPLLNKLLRTLHS